MVVRCAHLLCGNNYSYLKTLPAIYLDLTEIKYMGNRRNYIMIQLVICTFMILLYSKEDYNGLEIQLA
jgi:hypothetical protein